MTRELGGRAIKMPRLSTLSSFHFLSRVCEISVGSNISHTFFFGASTSVGKRDVLYISTRGK